MQNTGGRALKAKPSELKFPSLPHTSQLPVWGSENYPRLAGYFRKQWMFSSLSAECAAAD